MKAPGYFTPVRIVFWVVMLLLSSLSLFLGISLFGDHSHSVSDRALCIMQQRNIQHAVRSYADRNSLKPGDPLDWTKLIGTGLFIDKTPVCRIHGASAYKYSNVVPPIGTLAAPCKDPAHKPPNIEDW